MKNRNTKIKQKPMSRGPIEVPVNPVIYPTMNNAPSIKQAIPAADNLFLFIFPKKLLSFNIRYFFQF